MKPATDPHPNADDESAEPGYEAWKRDKIALGLAQSRQREAMIPVEQLWRDLKLER